MYEAARDRLGPGRVLAVGDLLEVDVAGARRAGLDSALVLTGGTSRAAADGRRPDARRTSPTRWRRSCSREPH